MLRADRSPVDLRSAFSEIYRAEPVIEAFADAARYWLLFGRCFLVLAQTDDSGYWGPVDLGATRASWNPREWLDPDRRRP
jgi:hypothetical protein